MLHTSRPTLHMLREYEIHGSKCCVLRSLQHLMLIMDTTVTHAAYCDPPICTYGVLRFSQLRILHIHVHFHMPVLFYGVVRPASVRVCPSHNP
jgi:hypothetical protein